MKIFSGLFFVLFIGFSLVQFNDSHVILWLSVYLFSAYTSFCAFKNYFNPLLLTLMCIAYGLGAIFLFPTHVSEWLHVEEQAKSIDMTVPFVEEARESMGLIICFLVNLVYLIKGHKGAKAIIPNYEKATEKPFD